MQTVRPILTITGSDPTSGSGIQADIKTISMLGGYAVTAITSVTVQTTLGIQDFHDLPASVVEGQIEAIMNDVQPLTVKVGMLRTAEVVSVVAKALAKYRPRHIIYTPVVHSTQGDALMTPDVVSQVKLLLLPLTTLVVCRHQDAEAMQLDGNVCQLDDATTHGLTNSFSSAAAFYLNQGASSDEALREARMFLNTQMARQSGLRGRSNELYQELLTAIEQNVRTNSDVRFYANLLCVGSGYLAQVTRRISGQSPKALIDSALTSEAERLLLTTGHTIQEIAYELGFSSQAHFAKFFRKQRGQSPSEYRHQTNNIN